MISWRASEAGTNFDSSNSDDIGIKSEIRRGIRGVRSLFHSYNQNGQPLSKMMLTFREALGSKPQGISKPSRAVESG
jgi:hypothetical protein